MSFDDGPRLVSACAMLALSAAISSPVRAVAADASPVPERAVATVNGARIAYEIQGRGHPLVLIHGGFMDLRMWDQQSAQLAQYYRVIRLNLRGYGGAELPAEKFSYVEDLHELLKQLGVQKTYLLGLSLGAMVAIDTATTYPEQVDALILASAPLIGLDPDPAEQARLGEQYKLVFTAYRRGDMEAAVQNTMALPFFNPARPAPDVRRRMETMVHDNLDHWIRSQPLVAWPEMPAIDRVSSIRAPTLVLVGDRDVKMMLAAADGLTARIKGARKVVIEGASHHINMEAPSEFNRRVVDFLSGL